MISVDVTQHACPASPQGDTHHLIERAAGAGERAQVCAYCGKSAAQLRDEIEHDQD